mgnify:FL=1|jgi:hypothetical protein|tara:strand:+ start:260 stop:466 length:207 start_codon:yes stop_codon:yes gene_type:complete
MKEDLNYDPQTQTAEDMVRVAMANYLADVLSGKKPVTQKRLNELNEIIDTLSPQPQPVVKRFRRRTYL